jgi:adenylate cyclase
VQDVIDVHLGHLNNDAYHLLGVAAVIGHVFSYELLQATTQWHRGRLLDSFDEILREALIEESEHGYRFQHAMIRQAVYNGLSAERRAWLHEQVAKALELLAANQLDEQATVLAHHYEHAGEYGTAIRYLIRAGDWARDAYALRESLEHYNRALELHRTHPSATDVETVTSLLERRSQTYLALSDFDSAIGDLEQLLKTYQETGMEARVGETLYQMGFAHYWAHRLMKAAMYLDQALYTAETLDYSDLRNRTLRLRDLLNSTQGSIVESAAEEIADESEKISSWDAEAYWGYAMLAHLRYDFESALQHAQTCIKVGHSQSNTFLTLGGYFILGMSQASLGDYQTALDSLQDALKLSETTGDRFWRARLLNTVGWVYRDLFSLGLAVQYDQASLELARASTPRLTEAEGNALANLAATYLLLGQHDLARTALDEGLSLSVTEPFMRWRYFTRLIIAQGRLALADGDVEEALNAAERALDMARNTKARKNIARSCALRGKVFLAMGEIDKARRAFAHALSVAENLKNVGMIWTSHLALAEVEEADGRFEVALAHYDAARDIIQCIASRLSNLYLREQFLNAAPTRKVLAHA